MKKVKPLKCRTMTLDELQLETLRVLRLVRKQFNRMQWEDGMSDSEFLDKVVGKLEHVIKQDRDVLRRTQS